MVWSERLTQAAEMQKHMTDGKTERLAVQLPPQLTFRTVPRLHTYTWGSVSAWGGIKGGDILKFKCTQLHLNRLCVMYPSSIRLQLNSYKDVIKKSYLEEFLSVHLFIAINIKHFESYMKSCVRLCNGNTSSFIWTLISICIFNIWINKKHVSLNVQSLDGANQGTSTILTGKCTYVIKSLQTLSAQLLLGVKEDLKSHPRFRNILTGQDGEQE